MFMQPTIHPVQLQDLQVLSDADLVLKIAQKYGWTDCKIFGHGDMIVQPLESMGWKLIPADLFEYSIPAEGVVRILQIINAGVQIQGVIIADDKHRIDTQPILKKPGVSLPSARTVFSIIGKALLGLVIITGVILLGFTLLAGLFMFAPMIMLNAAMGYDPKLIVLVEDGNGRMAWISVFTWYD
jgi:hypothetical protein